MHVQTRPDLSNSYVPEGPTQFEFCASRNSAYIWSTAYVCIHRIVQLQS